MNSYTIFYLVSDGMTPSTTCDSNPENDRERGRRVCAFGKKFALGMTFPATESGEDETGPDARDPLLRTNGRSPMIDVPCIRERLAGTLFGGSSVNDIGTGPIEQDRSYSNLPYIVTCLGRIGSPLAAKATCKAWAADPGAGPTRGIWCP